jgi:hypothetical protein
VGPSCRLPQSSVEIDTHILIVDGQAQEMGQNSSALHKTINDLEKNHPDLVELNLAQFSLGDLKLRRLAESLHRNKDVLARGRGCF